MRGGIVPAATTWWRSSCRDYYAIKTTVTDCGAQLNLLYFASEGFEGKQEATLID